MATIDALLGLGIEDGAETQALADSLRGRKRAADMFSLSTVDNIAQGAQREQDSVMEGAKRGGVLRQTMADRAAKKEEAENALAETVRSNNLRNNAAWAAIKPEEYINADGQTMAGRMTEKGLMQADGITPLDQTNWKLRKDPNASGYGTEDRFQARQNDRRIEKLDTNLRSYQKTLEDTNLPMAMRDVDFVDSFLSRLPGYDPETGDVSGIKEVPGIGYGQNAPVIGSALTFGEGLITGEDEVDPTQMKAAIQKMKNTVIKDISGSQVTVNELVRQNLAQASDWTSSDADFIKFWPQIKGLIAAQKKNVDSGYGPETVGLYDLRQSGENLTAREFLEGGHMSGPPEVNFDTMTDEELDHYAKTGELPQ